MPLCLNVETFTATPIKRSTMQCPNTEQFSPPQHTQMAFVRPGSLAVVRNVEERPQWDSRTTPACTVWGVMSNFKIFGGGGSGSFSGGMANTNMGQQGMWTYFHFQWRHLLTLLRDLVQGQIRQTTRVLRHYLSTRVKAVTKM